MKAPVFVFALLLAAPSTSFAQTWTRAQGTGYLNVSLIRLSGDRVFGNDFEVRDINRYSQNTLNLYGELGLIDRWLTATLSSELFRRNALQDEGATTGLGDLQVGLYTGLVESPVRLTFGVVVGLPTGDSQPSAEGRVDAIAELTANSLPTGDGEVDVYPNLSVGYSIGPGTWWPLRHYTIVEAGYWIRTRGFADAFRYKVEVGSQLPLAFADRFWLTIRLNGVESLASRSEVQSTFAGLGNGVTYTTFEIELNGRIYGGLGALASYSSALRARGLIAAAPIKLGLSYEF